MFRYRYAQALVAVILCSGCFFGPVSAGTPAADQSEITFLVGSSSDNKPLPGVEVILLASDKRILGRTDYLGSFVVKTSAIRQSNAHAVLFCTDRFFCGAIPVEPDLFEYSEKYIELAPFATR